MTTFQQARQLHPARAEDGASTARHDYDHPAGCVAPGQAASLAAIALGRGDLETAAYWSGYGRTVGALLD